MLSVNLTVATDRLFPISAAEYSRKTTDRSTRLVGLWLLIASAYLAAALWGFRAAFLSEQVTTVWVPTGVAEAALLLGGLRLWPGIWIGAFAANAVMSGPLFMNAGIATGNTLEAVAAAWLLRRWGRLDPMFSHVSDAIWFLAVGAALAPAISATIGVTMLHAAGVEPWVRFGELWREWWLGDALGALTVAPVLLTLARARGRLKPRELRETALWVGVSATVAAVASGRWAPAAFGDPSLVFLVFPFVIVAAVRLGQPATSLTVLTASTVIVWGLITRSTAPDGAALHVTLVRAQIFMGVLAGSGLLLAAAITERTRVESAAADSETHTRAMPAPAHRASA